MKWNSVNNLGVFCSFVQIFINETARLGTTVTWIKARDRDLGYNGRIVFGISSGDNDSVFRLDPVSLFRFFQKENNCLLIGVVQFDNFFNAFTLFLPFSV